MGIQLDNKEFQDALTLIQNTNKTFFLTGKAGTGKSTFLKHITKTVSKQIIVLAPTGIASVNVKGMTINSFFLFPLRPLLLDDSDIKIFAKGSLKRDLIEAMDTLIIDEVSMVRADVIDAIDSSLRKNGGDKDLPFGGKQVVFVGDVFQLEPVASNKNGEEEIIKRFYNNPYFFNAKVFEEIKLITIELLKVYRQNDTDFINLLDKVRINEIDSIDLLKLNNRLIANDELEREEFIITLSTTNYIADQVNQQKLAEIKKRQYSYEAQVTGQFESNRYPTDLELNLKVGAQIVFIKNDIDKRWFNGTIGKIKNLSENEITVILENGDFYTLEKEIWENTKYKFNRILNKIESEVTGAFKQYPLKLAWAITIHKSQGLTFDKVIIDFGSGAFAFGQAYVALSRSKTINGLFLRRKIVAKDIKVSRAVKEFAKSYNDEKAIKEFIPKNSESPDEKKIVQNIFINNPELFTQLVSKYFPNYTDHAKVIVKEIFTKNPELFLDIISTYYPLFSQKSKIIVKDIFAKNPKMFINLLSDYHPSSLL
jgi:ATP-dependent exoDNAse (exonuclease V) alpha subunit